MKILKKTDLDEAVLLLNNLAKELKSALRADHEAHKEDILQKEKNRAIAYERD